LKNIKRTKNFIKIKQNKIEKKDIELFRLLDQGNVL